MTLTKSDLLDLKAEIEEAQESASRYQGKKEMLEEQLKERFEVSSPAEGKKKLKALQQSINNLDEEIETLTTELEDELDEQNSNPEE